MNYNPAPTQDPESQLLTAACTHTWLVLNLSLAAAKIGCVTWWSLEDIAVAVRMALFAEPQPASIALPDLQTRIAAVLLDIGCPELAGSFRLIHPVLRVSLVDCARNPPLRNEREFFARLGSQIDMICHRGIQRLHLADLAAWEAGLSPMDGSFPWCPPALDRASIVTFVRQHLRSLPLRQSICCLIF